VAVQKSRKSRSKRNMRRSNNSSCRVSALSIDKYSGELHLRHHVSKNGYYRGKEFVPPINSEV
jgi:large subunit ribosomal protein L32